MQATSQQGAAGLAGPPIQRSGFQRQGAIADVVWVEPYYDSLPLIAFLLQLGINSKGRLTLMTTGPLQGFSCHLCSCRNDGLRHGLLSLASPRFRHAVGVLQATSGPGMRAYPGSGVSVL